MHRMFLSMVSARAGSYLWTSNMHKLVIFGVLLYVFVVLIMFLFGGKMHGIF